MDYELTRLIRVYVKALLLLGRLVRYSGITRISLSGFAPASVVLYFYQYWAASFDAVAVPNSIKDLRIYGLRLLL